MNATELICHEVGPPFKITNTFLETRTEIYDDGTKNLNLHGRQLDDTIGRRINDEDIKMICYFLLGDSDIVSLQLCYNNITDKGMSELAAFLEIDESVKYLDLMMNNIESDGIKSLVDLGSSLKLEALRLNGNNFGENGGIHLAELLAVNQTLVHLDIAESDQTIKSFVHLMTRLSYNATLKCLDISRVLGVMYYVLDIDHIAQVLCQMLCSNNTLVELHLQKMEITDFILETLIEGLQSIKSLLLLDLSCNQIGDVGIEHIGNFLKTNPPLQVIMLNHNRIRTTGATFLSYAITFSRVRFLDLAHNNIGEPGVLSLLYTIRKTSNLLVLFLFGNTVTGRAALLLELWLINGVLKQFALDVFTYRDEFNELQTAYNSEADWYNQRYYQVIGKFTRRERQLHASGTDLSFKYHNIVHMWELPTLK